MCIRDRYTVVLIRHGESTWNEENRFTGWTDVPLSKKGVQEAIEAGQMLKEKQFKFDICFTSVLKRAILTYNTIADQLDCHHIPVIKSYRLNERHYGALQGLNKSETAAKHGEKQVLIWRRSYDIPPPKLEETDNRFPGKDDRYNELPFDVLPFTECLKDTVERVLPYWNDIICPTIKSGKKVVIAAHGNSLRAIVKYLDNISDEAIVNLNIPTAIPLVYELDEKMRKVKSYYLCSEEELKKKMEAVANQGKAK
eukprot:TRINITY_DN364_c0_g1_i8.p1 TRINITY_DN364_c0_g1~~TRINITY_DN364_c0_g1_i8.p1  ORF type:complete len:254 (+),score=110.25 TRINITY_DN364_c0_g1_i8:75-836(+)